MACQSTSDPDSNLELALGTISSSQAEDRLLDLHDRRIRRFATAFLRKSGLRSVNADEVRQSARIGFLKAIRAYDPRKGASLLTFARKYMRFEILDDVKAGYQANLDDEHPLVSLDEYMSESHHDVADDSPNCDVEDRTVNKVCLERECGRFMSLLPQRLRVIADYLFWRGMNQAQVSRVLGVSEPAISKSVRQIEILGRQYLSRNCDTRLDRW